MSTRRGLYEYVPNKNVERYYYTNLLSKERQGFREQLQTHSVLYLTEYIYTITIALNKIGTITFKYKYSTYWLGVAKHVVSAVL